MELKPGYKQTEVGVIPEDWAVRPLGALADTSSGTTPSRDMQDRYYENGSIAWVKTLDLANSDLVTTKEQVTDLALKETCLRIYPAGTVLVAMYGGFNQIGRTGLLRIPAAVNQAITAIQPKPNSLLSEYLLETLNYRVDYWKTVASSSRRDPNITGRDIRNFPIAYPNPTEQSAIAAALCEVNALIRALDQLIAKKRDIKQAAMQQLLTGKKRLPGFGGQWRNCLLSDVATPSKGKGIRKDEVEADGLPCVRYGEIYTRHQNYIRRFYSFIPADVARRSERLRRGDLLFAGSGETAEEIGKCVAFLGDEEAYAGGDIVIFRPIAEDSMYLGYLMNESSIAGRKARLGHGDAVVHISARNLGRLQLRLPSLEEQNAIAKALADMDTELAALEQRRDKTLALKQGMMQELLTGRIRLV